jgi:hypothetical protein
MTTSSTSSLTRKEKQDAKSVEIDKQFMIAARKTETSLHKLALLKDSAVMQVWLMCLSEAESPEFAMKLKGFKYRISEEGQSYQTSQLFTISDVSAGDDMKFKMAAKTANGTMSTFMKQVMELAQAKASLLPAPSEFAKASVWPEYQNAEDPLLCGRPAKATGLPLSTLHDVFRQFYVDLRSRNSVTIKARQLAGFLCRTMPSPFSRDGSPNPDQGRSDEFDKWASPFLGHFLREQTFNWRGRIGKAEGTLFVRDILIALREMRAEPGDSGDVWFQLSCIYDIAATSLDDKSGECVEFFRKEGTPMFLIGVVGELLSTGS